VLKGVSLKLDRGEIVCLMGENGAGKTTLIDTLLSRLAPDRGTIAHNGKKLTTGADRAGFIARTAVIGHDAGIFPDLTGRENLEIFYRAYHNTIGKAGHALIELLLERAGLAARARDLARTFSRGMRQKLAICRTLLHDPEVLLLDEHLTALDPPGVRFFFSILSEFRETGCALIVTHDRAPFTPFVRRFIHLHDGQIKP